MELGIKRITLKKKLRHAGSRWLTPGRAGVQQPSE